MTVRIGWGLKIKVFLIFVFVSDTDMKEKLIFIFGEGLNECQKIMIVSSEMTNCEGLI